MKKIYMQPQTDVCEALPAQMIATSPGVSAPDQGIGYGGVDDGSNDPGVKGDDWGNIWD